MLRCIIRYALICAVSLAFGCNKTNPSPQDPYEGLNREIYGFNKTLDKTIIKPVSYLYMVYIPQPIQSGIGNFFENCKEIPNFANDLMQFKFAWASNDASRFFINSTLGILGIFDVASSLGLERHKTDFGHTLYEWGYKKSAYIILPLVGPSTFRDGVGFLFDYSVLSIWPWVEPTPRYILLTIDGMDTRARYLRHEAVLSTVAVDEYVFMRDAYFQRRKFLFKEKNEAEEESDDPFLDEDVEKTEKNPEAKALREKEKAKEKESPDSDDPYEQMYGSQKNNGKK